MAQESVKLRGSVLSEATAVVGQTIINQTLRKGTITNEKGIFTINVRVGDTLIIRGIPFETKKIKVTTTITDAQFLQVSLIREINNLDAVRLSSVMLTGDIRKDGTDIKLDPSKINNNPDALNPISSESRRLITATSRPADQVGQNNLRFDVSLDNIINTISGKKKRLKRNVEISNYAKKVKEIRDYYSDSIYILQLKIPKDNIEDFVFWALKDEKLLKEAQIDNKLLAFEYFLSRRDEYLLLIDKQKRSIEKQRL